MSISTDRYRQTELALAYHRMAEAPPRHVAEQLAHHYRSLFATANTLHQLVEMTRHGATEGGSADQAMAHLVSEIKTAHASAFGIELEWPKRDLREPV